MTALREFKSTAGACKRGRHRCLALTRRQPAAGPVAQWLEPAAHNGLVAGSSPAGPTSRINRFLGFILALLRLRTRCVHFSFVWKLRGSAFAVSRQRRDGSTLK